MGSKPVDIVLRGGETVLHVRTNDCEPIRGALVTVYMSGIDDMSEIVPGNIRKLLTKPTDANGTVRFPSRLGDYDLGFPNSADRPDVATGTLDHY